VGTALVEWEADASSDGSSVLVADSYVLVAASSALVAASSTGYLEGRSHFVFLGGRS
jgi:hypothetical protein